MTAERVLVIWCPELAPDARAYESVLVAVEEVVPAVEVIRPGACALAARGPSRYFGGETALVERLTSLIAERCGVHVTIGIADGVFAAGLAARTGTVVPAGQTLAFLAGLPVRVLGRPALASLLRRLGVRTLGDYAALPAADVLTRFGADAARAQVLAAGGEIRPVVPRTPPVELGVAQEFDEPIERIDVAAFVARSLAARLTTVLIRHGLACTQLVIEAETTTGTRLRRAWRNEGPITPGGIADRVRWQLDGWLAGSIRGGTVTPAGPIALLRLTPENVVPQLSVQPGLWGEPGEERDRAIRALTRVQGLLGPEAVTAAVLGGGRGQADRVRWVPLGDDRTPASGPVPVSGPMPGPWPGRLPAPSPATVYAELLPATVRDARGDVVGVTGRLAVTGYPTTIAIQGRSSVRLTGWSGPWPVDERWWAGERARRYARFQVLLADGRAFLLHLSGGHWGVAAYYD